MNRIIAILVVMVLLTGCSGSENSMDQALELRRQLQVNGCRFDAQISADYGDNFYTFTLSCQTDRDGNLSFTVTEPEGIAGISGHIDKNGGKLTFDDVALSFPLLADGQLTPVSAPWVFVSTLRGGYISAIGTEGAYTRLTIYDSYDEDALMVDIWLTEACVPIQAEIEWEDRRILLIEILNFQIL